MNAPASFIDHLAPLHRPTLAELVMAQEPDEGISETSIPGVQLFRQNSPSDSVCIVYEPALGVIAQGSKTVRLGDREVLYGPLTYMVTAIDLPVTGQIVNASEDEPFLAIKMSIDPKEVADLVLEMGEQPEQRQQCPCALSVVPVDYGILDAITRLAALLSSPIDA